MYSIDWVPEWLSAPRWQNYLAAVNHDAEKAIALYEWNLELASAIMHDIAHIEVAVRNTYDSVISAGFQGENHWLLDPNSPVTRTLMRSKKGKKTDVNLLNRQSIQGALKRLRRANPKPDQVIAELPFGFWRHLTDSAHEKTLWIPYLQRAFPKGTSRKSIEASLTLVNNVRNRASHHEPLFLGHRGKQLEDAYQAILDLAEMLLPPLATYIERTSVVHETLGKCPLLDVQEAAQSRSQTRKDKP